MDIKDGIKVVFGVDFKSKRRKNLVKNGIEKYVRKSRLKVARIDRNKK